MSNVDVSRSAAPSPAAPDASRTIADLPPYVLSAAEADVLVRAISRNVAFERPLATLNGDAGSSTRFTPDDGLLRDHPIQIGCSCCSAPARRGSARRAPVHHLGTPTVAAVLAHLRHVRNGGGAELETASQCGVQHASYELPIGLLSRATARRPGKLQVSMEEGRALMRRACAASNGEDAITGFAWADAPATHRRFVFTDALAPCLPVIVFWTDARGAGQATFFRYHERASAHAASHGAGFEPYITSLDPAARFESVCFVERNLDSEGRCGDRERALVAQLRFVATSMAAALHVFHHAHPQTPREMMAVIVDVANAIIITAPDDDLHWLTCDHPLGDDRIERAMAREAGRHPSGWIRPDYGGWIVPGWRHGSADESQRDATIGPSCGQADDVPVSEERCEQAPASP